MPQPSEKGSWLRRIWFVAGSTPSRHAAVCRYPVGNERIARVVVVRWYALNRG